MQGRRRTSVETLLAVQHELKGKVFYPVCRHFQRTILKARTLFIYYPFIPSLTRSALLVGIINGFSAV